MDPDVAVPRPGRWRERPRLVAGVALAALLAVLVGWRLVRRSAWSRPRPFDDAVWRSEAENVLGLSARHGMADEVRDRLLQERPTRAEVRALLGPASFASAQDEWYTLGMVPGLAVFDDCGLQVTYDAGDGRVAEVLVAHEPE